MTDEEIHRLIAGYATRTLTPAEQTALFEAALADQKVFNALQEEETLRDLLADAPSRRAIQQALEPRPRNWFWLLVPTLAAASLTVFVVTRGSPPPPPRQMAECFPQAVECRR